MKTMPVLTPSDLRTLSALHTRLGAFLNGKAPAARAKRKTVRRSRSERAIAAPARTRLAKSLAGVPE